ncbi:hypothetical protein GQX74_002971 [Glossina fuscipes]|nr:hypothetical protein GQX74_002971 [Glossina fuscipes]
MANENINEVTIMQRPEKKWVENDKPTMKPFYALYVYMTNCANGYLVGISNPPLTESEISVHSLNGRVFPTFDHTTPNIFITPMLYCERDCQAHMWTGIHSPTYDGNTFMLCKHNFLPEIK